eukprot:TRINITY_DN113779_c0_g1_i1.p1 TRINITY_DN113779_c0_g1~~TRINITY_DN113779_c0_g1_i1.p1  ORF type:complete len:215 (+),score=67.15 TRINITY_DN113779_c0_g1_i1:82-726(+)
MGCAGSKRKAAPAAAGAEAPGSGGGGGEVAATQSPKTLLEGLAASPAKDGRAAAEKDALDAPVTRDISVALESEVPAAETSPSAAAINTSLGEESGSKDEPSTKDAAALDASTVSPGSAIGHEESPRAQISEHSGNATAPPQKEAQRAAAAFVEVPEDRADALEVGVPFVVDGPPAEDCCMGGKRTNDNWACFSYCRHSEAQAEILDEDPPAID